MKKEQTLSELFDDVKIRTKSLRTRLIAETGSDILTEEWASKLTEEEREILKLAQWFKSLT